MPPEIQRRRTDLLEEIITQPSPTHSDPPRKPEEVRKGNNIPKCMSPLVNDTAMLVVGSQIGDHRVHAFQNPEFMLTLGVAQSQTD